MSDKIQRGMTVVLTICAVLVTGLVIRRELFTDRPSVRQVRGSTTNIAEWRRLAESGHRSGPPESEVTIVEFADFQCPACASAADAIERLRDTYGETISIVYRHYPLTRMHPNAFKAALASECAADQGKFWSFHDVVFAHQDSIGPGAWEKLAEMAAVPDLERFRECLASRRFEQRVRRDIGVADSIGITSTPTFIFEGRMFSGARPFSAWKSAVEDALNDR